MDSDRFQNSDKMCPDLEPVNGEIIYFQAAVASGAGSRAAGCVQNPCAVVGGSGRSGVTMAPWPGKG